MKHDCREMIIIENVIEISSIKEPDLQVYTSLTNPQLRLVCEAEGGIFIAEGGKVIGTALETGCIPRSFLISRRHIATFKEQVPEKWSNVPIYTADDSVLQELTGYKLTRGMLSAMVRPKLPSLEEVCASAKRMAVLENIVDATNVGAIFRSAAALEMDAVLVTSSCCDPFYRRAMRVSMGTVLQIPWTWIDRGEWPEPGLAKLREFGFKTVAMTLSRNSIPIDDPALLSQDKLAVVLGSEGDGLAPETIAECDFSANIPMRHGVDSLNVAAAGAVIFWQLRSK